MHDQHILVFCQSGQRIIGLLFPRINYSQGGTQLCPAWNDKGFFTVDFASLAPQ